MPDIWNQIRYNDETLEDVKNSYGRQQIIVVAAKLQSLAVKIKKEPNGRIDILIDGDIFVNHFSKLLSCRINALIY